MLQSLTSARLVTIPKGLPVHKIDVTLNPDLVAFTEGVIGVDPRVSRVVLDDGKIMGMYVQDALINTEAEPPYHRLPSFADHYPYHIVYLFNFEPSAIYTVVVRLQVFSAGTVKIAATSNPVALTIGQSSVALDVPVEVTTTDEGFASIFIQRVGEVGFDWFSAKVL